jgi:hypothetical protein
MVFTLTINNFSEGACRRHFCSSSENYNVVKSVDNFGILKTNLEDKYSKIILRFTYFQK